MKANYSDKEFAMIKALSPQWAKIIEEGRDGSLAEVSVLRILVEHCFIENLQGLAVESLRRCYKAIRECKPYRMTPEYDALIQL